MRKSVILALFACGLAVLFAAPASADEPAPTALQSEAPAAAPAPSAGACLDAIPGIFEPLPMAPLTCEECQQKCADRASQCVSHCHSRLCLDDCFDKEAKCYDGCPC